MNGRATLLPQFGPRTKSSESIQARNSIERCLKSTRRTREGRLRTDALWSGYDAFVAPRHPRRLCYCLQASTGRERVSRNGCRAILILAIQGFLQHPYSSRSPTHGSLIAAQLKASRSCFEHGCCLGCQGYRDSSVCEAQPHAEANGETRLYYDPPHRRLAPVQASRVRTNEHR
jgi:hypothetical protein